MAFGGPKRRNGSADSGLPSKPTAGSETMPCRSVLPVLGDVRLLLHVLWAHVAAQTQQGKAWAPRQIRSAHDVHAIPGVQKRMTSDSNPDTTHGTARGLLISWGGLRGDRHILGLSYYL